MGKGNLGIQSWKTMAFGPCPLIQVLSKGFYAKTAVEWLQEGSQGPRGLKCLLTDQLEKKFADPWSREQVFSTLTKEKFCDHNSNSERKEAVGTSSTISVNC